MGTLRLFLALVVVISHSRNDWGIPTIGGQGAVQLFYVVSGFLITIAYNVKYRHLAKGTWFFYQQRWFRIWVPYAVVALITILYMKIIPLMGGHVLGGSSQISIKALRNLDWETVLAVLLSNALLIGQDIGMFLAWVPEQGLYWTAHFQTESRPFYTFYIMDQSWTLGVELGFYLLAPFIVGRRAWVAILVLSVSLIARYGAARIGLDGDPWSYRFFPFELALFMLGCLAGKAYLSGFPRSGLWLWLSAVLPLPLVILWTNIPFIGTFYAALYVVVALCLPGLFRLTREWRWDRALGELSYPLYLVHVPVILMIRAHPQILDGVGTSVAAVVPLSVLAAIAVSRWVETPVENFRSRRLERRQSLGVSSH